MKEKQTSKGNSQKEKSDKYNSEMDDKEKGNFRKGTTETWLRDYLKQYTYGKAKTEKDNSNEKKTEQGQFWKEQFWKGKIWKETTLKMNILKHGSSETDTSEKANGKG